MVTQWRNFLSALGIRQVRRVVVFVVGMTVLLFGIALLVLPGPAILVIPAGLAILGLEFRWARRLMRRARAMIKSGEAKLFRRSDDSVVETGDSLRGRPPEDGSGARGLEATISDEDGKEERKAGEEKPKTPFGGCGDDPRGEKKGKEQIHAHCSQ